MTTIAPGSSDADTGAAEHAARVRKAHDTNISRAEGWRRRGPLLPALIFMIVVTQIPFLFTLYYSTLSWNLVRPGSRRRPTPAARGGASPDGSEVSPRPALRRAR